VAESLSAGGSNKSSEAASKAKRIPHGKFNSLLAESNVRSRSNSSANSLKQFSPKYCAGNAQETKGLTKEKPFTRSASNIPVNERNSQKGALDGSSSKNPLIDSSGSSNLGMENSASNKKGYFKSDPLLHESDSAGSSVHSANGSPHSSDKVIGLAESPNRFISVTNENISNYIRLLRVTRFQRKDL
jgi:hypothetical protein